MANTSNEQALAHFVELRDALTAAFDGAMELDDMRRIARAQHAVVDEILRLNRLAIGELGDLYQPQIDSLQIAIDDLKHIKADVKRISSSIQTIATIVSSIAKVLPLLAA